MSANIKTVPVGATIIKEYTTTLVNDSERTRYPGAQVWVTLYGGYASHGYQTDFTRVSHRWVAFRVHSSAPFEARWGRDKHNEARAWQFSGKRLDQADKLYNDFVDGLRELSAENTLDTAPAVDTNLYTAMDAAQYGY